MKKQKICIIGGSLAGLVTAISLSKLDCEIEMIVDNKIEQNIESTSRTIAISQNNYDYLNKLNISDSLKKIIWPCSIMKLYAEHNEEKCRKLFELDNEKKEKKILYMVENSKIIKLMMNKIKKIKSISLLENKKVYDISNSGLLRAVKYNNKSVKYNLIILCTGGNSDLVKKIFGSELIYNPYKETSIITILKHNKIRNNAVRQFFFNNEILALLPISNTSTSIVWSIKKNTFKKDFLIKEKIKFYTKNYLKNIKFISNIERKDLNFAIRSRYYKDRVLLFGDALHMLHPFVGQGFNMILRDLESLEKILSEKMNLGLDIGTSDILNEFSSKIKPRNFIFSIGTNLLKNSLSHKELRNLALKSLNKSSIAKNIFFNVADKGFRF